MQSIYQLEVVKEELNRLERLIGTDEGREVQVDIDILKKGLERIENELLNGHKDFVIIELNMWDECHNSLDKIISSLNLKYDDELSNYDYYQFAIKHAEGN